MLYYNITVSIAHLRRNIELWNMFRGREIPTHDPKITNMDFEYTYEYPVAVREVNSSRNKHACVVPIEVTYVNIYLASPFENHRLLSAALEKITKAFDLNKKHWNAYIQVSMPWDT